MQLCICVATTHEQYSKMGVARSFAWQENCTILIQCATPCSAVVISQTPLLHKCETTPRTGIIHIFACHEEAHILF